MAYFLKKTNNKKDRNYNDKYIIIKYNRFII